jgi:hypothetical protein
MKHRLLQLLLLIFCLPLYVAFQPFNIHFYTSDGKQTRTEVFSAINNMVMLTKDAEIRRQFVETLKQQGLDYIDETADITPQAAHNWGKLTFDVASFFIGAGEIKELANGAKLTTVLVQSAKNMATSLVLLTKATGNLIKAGYIKIVKTGRIIILKTMLDVEVARFSSEGILHVSNWMDEPAEVIAKIADEPISYTTATKTGMEELALVKDRNGLEGIGRAAAKGGLADDLLEAWAKFADNLLDVADAGLKNWKTFQLKVSEQLKILHPNRKIGSQIYLDVTYIDNAGKTVVKTIIPDNLIQMETNGITKYKVIDAKTSINDDLVNMQNLTGKCTANQKEIYPLIDDLSSEKIVKVEMKGGQAIEAFGPFLNNAPKMEIQLEAGVEFWVNISKNDFSQYLVRTRIK